MIKNKPTDFLEGFNDKLNGIYRGVIEDNNDPEKMGRCKIRVFTIHSPNKIKTKTDGIPTDELPGCEPVMGLFEGSISGFGSGTVPLQGSHVMVFFEAGNIQNPRYFATIPGKPTDQNHGFTDEQGFSDPDGVYPNKLNESDFNRLARNDDIANTLVQTKKDNLESGILTANGAGDEPTPYYNSKYPHNKVLASNSGITIEIDDTNGSERIHIGHPSNSYIEVGPDGNVIIKNNNDRYDIVKNDEYKYVENNSDETISNNKTCKVGSDETNDIGSSRDETIGSNLTQNISGNKDETIGGSKNTNASSSIAIISSTSISLTAPSVSIN